MNFYRVSLYLKIRLLPPGICESFRSRLTCIILYLVFVFSDNFKREMRLWFSSNLTLVCFAQVRLVRLHYAPRSYPVRLRLDWADSPHINRLSVFFFLGRMWSDLVGFFQHKERLVVGNRKQHLLSLCFRNSSVKTGALNPGKSSSSSLSFNFPDTVCLCFRPRMCSLLLWRLLKYWLHGLQ